MTNERFIRPSDLLELYENTSDLNMDTLSVPVPVIRQNIKDMSVVEAREVVRSKWNYDGTCRNCGRHILSNYMYFCPNCGADMREVEND